LHLVFTLPQWSNCMDIYLTIAPDVVSFQWQ
jgi:hypothetical protein